MITEAQKNHIHEVFSAQEEVLDQLRKAPAKIRIRKIQSIVDYLSREENEQRLAAAMYADMKRPYEDVIAAELVVVFAQARYVKSNLREWMRPERVSTPILLAGLQSYIQYEPKGRALIISPWNYPFQLAIWPLLYAIAAGCSVIIKPSEISPETSAFIRTMIEALFPPNEIAVITGDAEVATELLSLPFDHIHFTGSPAIGKIVMKAAAKNLSSVTLELGGKCPVIIDASADVKDAGHKIAWAKTLNCGQTCLAPDYVLVHTTVLDDFLNHFTSSVQALHNSDQNGIQQSETYGRIVSKKHFSRIAGLLQDAIKNGAEIYTGGTMDEEDRYIEPTVITGINMNMEIMKEEIFGPLLPVIPFSKLEDIPTFVRQLPKPLSLYIFSKKTRNQKYILHHTSSGGAMINELMLGSVNTNLPFGGVNNSGIGKINGHHGFLDYCNEKSVMKRKWGTLSMIYPPFNRTIINAMKWASKYF